MSIFPVSHIRTHGSINELLSIEGCPCNECLVQPMCLKEGVNKVPWKGIKSVHTTSKHCYKLTGFLNELSKRNQKWKDGSEIGYISMVTLFNVQN